MRNFGLKFFSLVTIFMILIQVSSSTVPDSSGDEQLETMVEEDENELAYSSRTHGYIPNTTFFFFFFAIVSVLVHQAPNYSSRCVQFFFTHTMKLHGGAQDAD